MLSPEAGSRVISFQVWVKGSKKAARWVPPSRFDIGRWHHYLGSLDGSVIRLYVDGVQRASVKVAGAVQDDSGRLFIGRDDRRANHGAAGIDEVAVYDTALPARHILAHARADQSRCVSINGATRRAYRPHAADTGSQFRVKITATNATGASSATSSQTAPVMADLVGAGRALHELETGESGVRLSATRFVQATAYGESRAVTSRGADTSALAEHVAAWASICGARSSVILRS